MFCQNSWNLLLIMIKFQYFCSCLKKKLYIFPVFCCRFQSFIWLLTLTFSHHADDLSVKIPEMKPVGLETKMLQLAQVPKKQKGGQQASNAVRKTEPPLARLVSSTSPFPALPFLDAVSGRTWTLSHQCVMKFPKHFQFCSSSLF